MVHRHKNLYQRHVKLCSEYFPFLDKGEWYMAQTLYLAYLYLLDWIACLC